jgi:ketosteroid isomerase-like protein
MHARRVVPGFFSLMLLLCFAVPTSGQETQDAAQLPEGLRAARASLDSAFAKLDAGAAAALFTASGSVEFQGQTFAGRDAVGGWFAEAFAGLSGLKSGTSTFVVADGEVTERASYVVSISDGTEQQGTSETLWKRQEDGTWRVVRLVVT